MRPYHFLPAIIAIFLTATAAEYGAMPAPGLRPRYNLGEARLLNRQTGVCPENNEHTCLDINFSSFCCSNHEYCIVTNSTAACCFIGSTCGNLCDANHYECPVTTTISNTATVTTSCCARSCTSTSQYLCASALGGQCCGYSEGCGANSACVATSTSSNVPSSTGSSTGTSATGSSSPSSSSSGLSTGAKAGIGAGIAVVALLVISALLYFCVIHRRRARLAASTIQATSQAGSEKRPSHGRSGSDYFGPTAAAGPFTEPHDSNATSPISPNAYRGVPLSPQSPGDISIPVEIDSRGQSNVTTPAAGFEYIKGPNTRVDPVEMP